MFPINRVFFIFLLGIANFGLTQTGPGGVGNSTNNVLWLRCDGGAFIDAGITQASSGQQVQQWQDNSGNGNNATQLTGANRPIFDTNIANGFPSL